MESSNAFSKICLFRRYFLSYRFGFGFEVLVNFLGLGLFIQKHIKIRNICIFAAVIKFKIQHHTNSQILVKFECHDID